MQSYLLNVLLAYVHINKYARMLSEVHIACLHTSSSTKFSFVFFKIAIFAYPQTIVTLRPENEEHYENMTVH